MASGLVWSLDSSLWIDTSSVTRHHDWKWTVQLIPIFQSAFAHRPMPAPRVLCPNTAVQQPWCQSHAAPQLSQGRTGFDMISGSTSVFPGQVRYNIRVERIPALEMVSVPNFPQSIHSFLGVRLASCSISRELSMGCLQGYSCQVMS